MKKNNLTSGLYAVLLLTGVTVSVWAAQYPAATEPEVLYQDADYIAEHSQSKTLAVSSDPQNGYPVTDQQPEILYQDSDYIASHGGAESEIDSKYPGMNSGPEILYQNTDYIAKH